MDPLATHGLINLKPLSVKSRGFCMSDSESPAPEPCAGSGAGPGGSAPTAR